MLSQRLVISQKLVLRCSACGQNIKQSDVARKLKTLIDSPASRLTRALLLIEMQVCPLCETMSEMPLNEEQVKKITRKLQPLVREYRRSQ